jgi:hypothetical protein
MSTNSESQPIRYPLLESLLRQKGLSLQGICKCRDATQIFFGVLSFRMTTGGFYMGFPNSFGRQI